MVRVGRKCEPFPLESSFTSHLSFASQALLEPFNHINSVPGKDIRGTMIAAFNKWLQVPGEKLETISRVVSMLHTASLMYVAATYGMCEGILDSSLQD